MINEKKVPSTDSSYSHTQGYTGNCCITKSQALLKCVLWSSWSLSTHNDTRDVGCSALIFSLFLVSDVRTCSFVIIRPTSFD